MGKYVHGSRCRRLLEAIYPPDVVERMDFRGKAAMDAEKLCVDKRCKRKRIKGRHTHIVDIVGVLDLAYSQVTNTQINTRAKKEDTYIR